MGLEELLEIIDEVQPHTMRFFIQLKGTSLANLFTTSDWLVPLAFDIFPSAHNVYINHHFHLLKLCQHPEIHRIDTSMVRLGEIDVEVQLNNFHIAVFWGPQRPFWVVMTRRGDGKNTNKSSDLEFDAAHTIDVQWPVCIADRLAVLVEYV